MTDLSTVEQLTPSNTAYSRKIANAAQKELIQKLSKNQNAKRLAKTKRAASNVFAALVVAACLISVFLQAGGVW